MPKRKRLLGGFDQYRVGECLPGRKKWTTLEVIEAINQTLPEPTTKRKVLYRVTRKKFTPLPQKVGKSYIWMRSSAGALVEQLLAVE